MPSSFTPSLRLELQAAGENLNTWGAPKLNNVIARLDASVAGWMAIALTGDRTLTASNGDDEARNAMLKFTGAGGFTVTVPSVSKRYDVWNAQSGPLVLTTGAGTTAVLQAGETCSVVCDGSGLRRVQPTDLGGARLTRVGGPSDPGDAATKAYVDAAGFAMTAGSLPGQSGNAGRFLGTDGVVAGWADVLPPQGGQGGRALTTDGASPRWKALTTADLSDYAADQAVRAVDQSYQARAMRR